MWDAYDLSCVCEVANDETFRKGSNLYCIHSNDVLKIHLHDGSRFQHSHSVKTPGQGEVSVHGNTVYYTVTQGKEKQFFFLTDLVKGTLTKVPGRFPQYTKIHLFPHLLCLVKPNGEVHRFQYPELRSIGSFNLPPEAL